MIDSKGPNISSCCNIILYFTLVSGEIKLDVTWLPVLTARIPPRSFLWSETFRTYPASNISRTNCSTADLLVCSRSNSSLVSSARRKSINSRILFFHSISFFPVKS